MCACLQHRRYRTYCHSIMRDSVIGKGPAAKASGLLSRRTHHGGDVVLLGKRGASAGGEVAAARGAEGGNVGAERVGAAQSAGIRRKRDSVLSSGDRREASDLFPHIAD